jgi:hypothetical protein
MPVMRPTMRVTKIPSNIAMRTPRANKIAMTVNPRSDKSTGGNMNLIHSILEGQ